MDPQACLLEMLEDLYRGAYEDANERLLDLLEWHEKGGFTPDLAKALNQVLNIGLVA